MYKKHLIWWYINHHFECKGTTKNAHTQVMRAFFGKIIDSLSIEAVSLLLVGSWNYKFNL